MKEEPTRLAVHVQPGAGRNRVADFREDTLYLKIAAPPVRGKANRELIDYLGDILGIPRSRISIIKGATGRRKLVEIGGLDQEQIIRKINDILVEEV